MQYTENYNLNKPELTDVADITKLSDNMDIIDEELEKRTTKSGFLTDLITHLASDAAIAISSLSTDSVFYRLLSYALNAAGVQYNFTNANAWYICLGALFGGLIIQGGTSTPDGNYASVATFPLAFTTLLKVVGTGSVSYGDTSYLSSPYSVQNIIEATSVTRAAFRTNQQGGYPRVDYIAFGF